MSATAHLDRLDRRTVAIGGLVFAVLMALSPLYGFDRDELYFLDAARHLQGGYVDQPILVPLLARISLSLFGVSAPGLRLWPALAAWATIVVAALIARELGGGRRSQVLAAFGTATMPALLAIDHLEGPTSIDVLAWAVLAFVALRVGRTGNPRCWLVGGLVLGIGLANKHSIGFFALALFVGLLLSRGHRLVLNRWFLAGALLAAAFTVPDLIWQAQHGWATVAMTRSLNESNGGAGNVGNWFAGQLIMTSLALVWV
ncbi:MAG: glycosyltransferase family 39 protein, partial [Acidimicrobiales bacterium]